MDIRGKKYSTRHATPDGLRSFYQYFARLEAADQDVSFVLQVNQPGHKTAAGAHDWEQWFFVHCGSVRFTIVGDDMQATAGDLVYVPRQVVHCHEALGEEAAELLVINHWPHDTTDRLPDDEGTSTQHV